jgi:hypothetical protein
MSFGETFGSLCDSFDTVSYVCDTVRVVFFTPVTCAKRAHLEMTFGIVVVLLVFLVGRQRVQCFWK